MIRRYFSRFTYRYPRTLTYMLQASEYYIGDYLSWLCKVKDFRTVEISGRLKPTSKAKLIYLVIWLEIFVFIVAAGYLLYFAPALRLWGAFLILLTPVLVTYGIIPFVYLLKFFVEKPLEFFVAKKIKTKLQNHKAIKIGIAGSYGKTTMREVLKSILSVSKVVAAPGSSINTFWGINNFVNNLKGDEEVLIFELGEYYPGDIRRLCNIIKPDLGLITGINEAHLKRFKTIDRTVVTIYELVDCLGDKTVYINGENELAKKYARGNYKLYSKKGIDNWQVKDIETDLTGTSFKLAKDKNLLSLKTSLLGEFQVGPVVAAVNIGQFLGLTDKQIIAGVKNTKPYNRRLEMLPEKDGVITIDDSYNGNPDGVRAVIDFLKGIKGHRKFYVTSGLVEMGEKSLEIHREIGKNLAESGIENIILIKNSATPEIEKGLNEAKFKGNIYWYQSTKEAYAALAQMTAKDDLVLLQTDWPDQYQ